jgi:carboxymethylenebutenolidase
MSLKTEYVTLNVSDGTTMRAYVARPEGQPKAAMLVFQEAFGVNAHIRDVTERFARQGYLSISPELYHRSAPGFEGTYDNLEAIFPLMRGLTDAGLEADIRAAFDWLQSASKGIPTGAVGYCMGGRVTTLATITVPVRCGISYYGGGIAPNPMMPGLTDRLKDLKAPMLFFWGGLDKHITPDQVQAVNTAMRATGKPYMNVEISYADHGFFCDARASYNATAAAQAWALTLAFLETNLAGQSRGTGA